MNMYSSYTATSVLVAVLLLKIFTHALMRLLNYEWPGYSVISSFVHESQFEICKY